MATLRTINLDYNELLLNPILASSRLLGARYNIIGGGKDAGKTAQIAIDLVGYFLENPNRHIAVIRKYESYNITSTFPKLLWVFSLYAKTFNLPQLEPVSAEDYRRKDSDAIIKFKKTAPQYIENTVTGQKIWFTGLDRLASGGFELENSDHAIDKIWCEEFVDIEDMALSKSRLDDTS